MKLKNKEVKIDDVGGFLQSKRESIDEYFDRTLKVMLYDRNSDIHYMIPKCDWINKNDWFKTLKKTMNPKFRETFKPSDIGSNTVGGTFKDYVDEIQKNGKPTDRTQWMMDSIFGCYLQNNGKKIMRQFITGMKLMNDGVTPMIPTDVVSKDEDYVDFCFFLEPKGDGEYSLSLQSRYGTEEDMRTNHKPVFENLDLGDYLNMKTNN